MASLFLRSAAAAAALLVLWGAPAHAQTVPEGPVRIFLKDHEDLPLAADDTGVRLSAVGDLWTLQPAEALVPLGGYRLVHDESGQCLTADTSGGGETAPVALADCAGAVVWSVVYDDRTAHYDYRFATPDGYHLGLETNDAVEGARVRTVKVDPDQTLHSQEWQFAGGDAPTPPPSETPSGPGQSATVPGSDTSSPALPMLPQTGVGMGVAAGAGAVALLGGAALVLWWQRRRALRSVW
jgi:LPXTG-motif cell wall-anchored protein